MFLKCLLLLIVLNIVNAQYYGYPKVRICQNPTIEHGRVRFRQRTRLAKFSCLARYTLVGNRYATCRNGEWDVAIPVCVRSGCPALPDVSNAMAMSSHNGAWIVFFCFPKHNLIGSSVIYCNGRQWNDTVPQCVYSTQGPKLSCDFEDPDLCGWTLDNDNDFDWRRMRKNETLRSIIDNGPKFDHTEGQGGNGYYMYTESIGRVENEKARLMSPVYDWNLATNGCFSFFYYMFGGTMGGLKVYQIPVTVRLYQLNEEQKLQYLLFEKYGNQGDDWYNSVTHLNSTTDDFQIVIEGIKGYSILSDIAIDDVAILNSTQCEQAISEANTPPPETSPDSCVGRCNSVKIFQARSCGCNFMCVITDDCCVDYMDVCEFAAGVNVSDSASQDDTTSTSVSPELPQTEKLILTSTPSYTSSTSTSSTTSTTTTTTTTRRPTTRTTPSTTTRTTTAKPKRTSTDQPRTTTVKAQVVTKPVRTTTRVVKLNTTTMFTTSTAASTSRRVTAISKTTATSTTSSKLSTSDKLTADVAKSSGPSGGKITLIVFLVIGALGGVAWVLFILRGNARWYRVSARARRDPEVRFLKNDVDDEE